MATESRAASAGGRGSRHFTPHIATIARHREERSDEAISTSRSPRALRALAMTDVARALAMTDVARALAMTNVARALAMTNAHCGPSR
jgi:hypothetical protein